MNSAIFYLFGNSQASLACALLPHGALLLQWPECCASVSSVSFPITVFCLLWTQTSDCHTLYTWVSSKAQVALGGPRVQDSTVHGLESCHWRGDCVWAWNWTGVCVSHHYKRLEHLLFDYPVSLQMKPSFHQMFQATCLLRGPFLIDRKVWSGLRVAIRPMGTLRAMVRPQSLMRLCSHELKVASSPSPGQVYGITLSTFKLEGGLVQSFLLGFFWI